MKFAILILFMVVSTTFAYKILDDYVGLYHKLFGQSRETVVIDHKTEHDTNCDPCNIYSNDTPYINKQSAMSVLSKYKFNSTEYPEWECIGDILLYESIDKNNDILLTAISKKVLKQIYECYGSENIAPEITFGDFIEKYWFYMLLSYVIIAIISKVVCKLIKKCRKNKDNETV